MTLMRTFYESECECCHRTETKETKTALADATAGWRIFNIEVRNGPLASSSSWPTPQLEGADGSGAYWLCDVCLPHVITTVIVPFRELMQQPLRLLTLAQERKEHEAELLHALTDQLPGDEA